MRIEKKKKLDKDLVIEAFNDYKELANEDKALMATAKLFGKDSNIIKQILIEAEVVNKEEKKESSKKEIVTIEEEVTIPVNEKESVTLGKGDKIEVLREASTMMMDKAFDMVDEIFAGDYEAAFTELIMGMSDDDLKDAIDYIYRMWQ